MRQTKEAEAEAPAKTNESTTSRIDLRSLRVEELLSLKESIEGILAEADTSRMRDTDLLLEYDIRIRTKDGVCCSNSGSSRLNGILGPRAISSAPGRLEAEFENQVFGPINSDLYDLIESHNPNEGSILTARGMLPAYNERRPIFEPEIKVLDLNG